MSSSRHDDRQDRPVRSSRSESDRVRERDSDYLVPESDEIIRRVMEIIDSSPSMPMSSSVRVNKEEVLEMLDDALRRFPEEVRQARWLLKDREAFLAEREREGEAIVERAAANAARLVDRREVVKTAHTRAEEIVDEATRTARRRQREADDYCDQQLARYENALVKLHRQVSKMRDRLAAPSIEESELGAVSQDTDLPRGGSSGPRTGQTRAVRTRAGQRRQAATRSEGDQSSEPSGSNRAVVFDQDE